MANLIRYRFWNPLVSFDSLAPFCSADNIALDILEKDNALVVKAALPGINREDIEVETRQNWLTIRTKQREERQQSGEYWHLRERYYGAWQRTVRLPEGLLVDKADAELKDGVLTIHFPKVYPTQSLLQRIKVNLPKIRPLHFAKHESGKIEISRN